MKKNILIIDDDKSISAILSFILNQSKISTKIATSSSRALDILTTQDAFNLILLDLKLSKSTDINLFKKMSIIAPNTPVIAMTKFTNTKALKTIFNIGFYGILYKPFDVAEVHKIINSVLGLKPAVNSI